MGHLFVFWSNHFQGNLKFMSVPIFFFFKDNHTEVVEQLSQRIFIARKLFKLVPVKGD